MKEPNQKWTQWILFPRYCDTLLQSFFTNSSYIFTFSEENVSSASPPKTRVFWVAAKALLKGFVMWMDVIIEQRSSTLQLETHCTVAFSSNPNQTNPQPANQSLQDCLKIISVVCWSNLEVNIVEQSLGAGSKTSAIEPILKLLW